jgi:hypothetical protein
MKRSSLLLVTGLLLLTVAIVVIVVLIAAFTPENTNPAFRAAVDFVHAAGTGNDSVALNLLAPEVQAYVEANCPEGSVSACIRPYTPADWGRYRSVVFRRAVPDGDSAWDVDLIATYEEDKGFSGVCIYNRVERDAGGEWRVAAWAGFIHCGEGASRNMATNPDTPNRVP